MGAKLGTHLQGDKLKPTFVESVNGDTPCGPVEEQDRKGITGLRHGKEGG